MAITHVLGLIEGYSRLKLLFSFSVLLVLACPAHSTDYIEEEAQEKFQIEYILFLHKSHNSTEQNPAGHQYKPLQNNEHTRLISGFEPITRNQFELLTKEQMTLSKPLDSLIKSKQVDVIEYGAWQQAIPPESTLPSKKVSSLTGVSSNNNAYREQRLEGTLTIKRSRYMHIQAELYLSSFFFFPEPSILNWLLASPYNNMSVAGMLTPYSPGEFVFYNEDSSRVSGDTFSFDQSRRLKYGEIHYLDHPAIGLIITINKISTESGL